MGRRGGTFHLRGKALRDSSLIRVTHGKEDGSLYVREDDWWSTVSLVRAESAAMPTSLRRDPARLLTGESGEMHGY